MVVGWLEIKGKYIIMLDNTTACAKLVVEAQNMIDRSMGVHVSRRRCHQQGLSGRFDHQID